MTTGISLLIQSGTSLNPFKVRPVRVFKREKENGPARPARKTSVAKKETKGVGAHGREDKRTSKNSSAV
jgi:hypothetical protein